MRNEAQAKDMVQEVFLRAHRYRNTFRGDASPMSWLFTISDRCCFDAMRKVEFEVGDQIETFVANEREGSEAVFQRQDLVAKLLSRASKDVRQIVVHRFFDELEHQQIAQLLGINEKTVRRKLEKFFRTARKIARRI